MSKRASAAKLSLGVLIDAVLEGSGFVYSNHATAIWVPVGGGILALGFLFVDGWRLVGAGMVVGVFILLLLAIVFILLGGAGGGAVLFTVAGAW